MRGAQAVGRQHRGIAPDPSGIAIALEDVPDEG